MYLGSLLLRERREEEERNRAEEGTGGRGKGERGGEREGSGREGKGRGGEGPRDPLACLNPALCGMPTTDRQVHNSHWRMHVFLQLNV